MIAYRKLNTENSSICKHSNIAAVTLDKTPSLHRQVQTALDCHCIIASGVLVSHPITFGSY